MSTGQYVLGVLLLVVVVGSLAVTARLIRRMLLPGWSRSPARVAEGVVGIFTVVLVGQLLGAVGVFDRWPFVLSCVAVAVATTTIFRVRAGARVTLAREELSAPALGVAPTVAAALVVGLAVIPWLQNTLTALHAGMREFDTLTYHMPFAARFVQTGSLTGLQYVGNPPVSFYPANNELVHAIGMLLFQRDILSPVLNLGWLGFALLASWSVGRPAGVGPATMATTALVASLGVVASSQAGTAKNDIAALSLLLAAVALLINAPRSRPALALAAATAGLAIGTRLNLWASALALGIVVIAAARRGRRAGAVGWWALGLVVGGGFWYVRNFVQAGNPTPWFGVRIPGVLNLPSTTAAVDCGRTSVAHYLTNPGFINAHLIPQLALSFGGRWWLVVSLAGAGIAAGLISRGTPMGRALAAVALVSAAAYVLTPATAGGAEARCFAFNTRFAVPAVALGMLVLPLVLARHGIRQLLVVLAILIALLVDAHLPLAPAPLLGAIVLVIGIAVMALGPWRAVPRSTLSAATILFGLAVVAVGWREQRIYLHDRYTRPNLAQPVESIAAALRHVSHARVAVTGLSETYPLYGLDLSNYVDLPAARLRARFVPYSTCRSWLGALNRGRYNYVVTARKGTGDSLVALWTSRDPGAREVVHSAPGTMRQGVRWQWELFRLQPSLRVDALTACARLRSQIAQ